MDTNNTITSAADIVFATKVVALKVLKTPAGEEVRVRIRKLDIAEMAVVRARFPSVFQRPTKAELDAAARSQTPNTDAKIADGFKRAANAVIIAAVEEPKFCEGRVGVDGAAPVEALYDDDRALLFDEILKLSDMIEGDASSQKEGNGGAAADGLASFPAELPGGSEAGGPAGDAV